ncbi:MAG TPA: PP2C family protein-serine/threonine phosphatase [Ignavibacteria bacterium]|nr:PP2C family protein-serine/threonine phosphatase [Ignavibacteria bacterium]
MKEKNKKSLPKETIFRKVYDFYSKDLTSQEVERVFFQETQTRYKYYVRGMEKPDEKKNTLSRYYFFTKNFALAFLKKLSPVIRITFSLNIIIFIFSMFQGSWDYVFFSFIVANLILIFEVAEKLTARDELDVARDVQMSMIPQKPPDDENFEIACHYETAKEVGGDFIDFISKDDGSYYISIGDISGKGMSAALYMLQVRLLLRHLADFSDNPRSILSSVNKNVFKHIKKGLYFSAILANIKGKNISFCRAGHTPVLYYNSMNRTCCEIKQTGMALGLNNTELFEGSLEDFNITSNKDDVLLFYSDGLTETMNTTRSEFGVDKVKEMLITHSHKSADEIKNEILTEVSKFRGYAEVHDDLTMIIMKAK